MADPERIPALAELHRLLAERKARPRAFQDVTEIPWSDPDIGRQFLRACRPGFEQTEEQVGFLVDKLDLREGSRVLDVMCGDGRVSLPLAQHGCWVSGVDVNDYVIELARQGARRLGLEDRSEFHCADVREHQPGARHDAAICIFGHLSGFERGEAVTILRHMRERLVEGGLVLIDMHLGPAGIRQIDGDQDWGYFADGWLGTDHPALVLDQYFTEPEALTYVRRSHCIDLHTGEIRSFGQAGQFYDQHRMSELLTEAGLELVAIYGDFDGCDYDDDSSSNLIALAQR